MQQVGLCWFAGVNTRKRNSQPATSPELSFPSFLLDLALTLPHPSLPPSFAYLLKRKKLFQIQQISPYSIPFLDTLEVNTVLK
jgi:hypothetical protein